MLSPLIEACESLSIVHREVGHPRESLDWVTTTRLTQSSAVVIVQREPEILV